MENWSCHDRLEADLSCGLQIEGRNGTGKSSVLEAIRFIFRKTASGYTGRIRNGERQALVELSFSRDGKTYVVSKTLHVDKPSTALMLCDSMQVADNPTSVYNALQRILPEDVLDKLIYVPQNQITSVLDKLSGKEGKVELDRLFGLDKLELVWERIGVEVGESEAKKEILEGQFKKYPEDALAEFERRASELRSASEELNGRISECQKQEADFSSKLKSCEERLSVMNENRRKLESARSELSRIQVHAEGLRKDIENARQRIDELKAKKTQLEKAVEGRKALEKFRALRKLLVERKTFSDRIVTIGDMNHERERIKAIEKELLRKQELERGFVETEQWMKDAEKGFLEKTGELKRVMEYFVELNSLESNAKCPRCGQILTDFHLASERSETSKQIKVLEGVIAAREKGFNEAAMKFDESKKALTLLRDRELELKHLRDLVEKHDKNESGIKASMTDVDNKLSGAGYGGESLQAVESKVEELNRLEAKAVELEGDVKALDKLMENEKAMSEKLADTEARKSGFQKTIESIAYDEKEFDALKFERDKTMESKYAANAKVKTMEKDLEASVKESRDIESKKKEYSELKKSFDNLSKSITLLKAAREVFHRDKGLARYLRERFVGQLNSRITHYFKKFNQKPSYLEVSFDREYNIKFKTTSGVLDLDQISGGERIQLALALRLALIDVMSPVRLLILDEPFGSLDEEHREILGETLSRIAEAGQLILVTHIHVNSLNLSNNLELGGY
ncbi:MAG: SMC family ATPase [Candidatus Altiarchaeota archaeon]|nr:SMC family ATPase [Candidatus Altiarchaeota archaeon]